MASASRARRNAASRAVRRYFGRLYRHFGPQQWWPGRTRFEVILGALLTQNTAWSNVKKAFGNLRREASLSPEKLARVASPKLSRLLRPSGYFRQKTHAVRGFLHHLNNHYRGSLNRLLARPTSELRDELLSLRGIGPETADSILLYAAGRPVFVIDAYTRRVLARHGLAAESTSYAELQDFFHRHLPADAKLFNEYHALLVAVGKKYCHSRQPDCAACPLEPELARFQPAGAKRAAEKRTFHQVSGVAASSAKRVGTGLETSHA